jgi:hypothetical protein
MKLSEKLAQVQATGPKRSPHGQLHTSAADTRGRWKKITVWTLFESSESTHLLRPHVFEKAKAKSARDWHAWLSGHFDGIQKQSIVPALNLKTDRIWRVQRVLGWFAGAVSESRIAAVARRRRAAKR